MRCPVCEIADNGQDICRRCGADLSELQRLAQHWNRLYQEAVLAMIQRNYPSAEEKLRLAQVIRSTQTLERLFQIEQELCGENVKVASVIAG